MATLSNEYKKMLMELTPDDITAEFINKYLADTCERKDGKLIQHPSLIKTYDTFTLEKGEYFNKEKVLTNVGLFIYNKFIIETYFKDVVGYINTPITGDVHSDIEKKLSNALLNDVITPEQMADYLNRIQWLSKQFNSVFSGSFTMNTLKPIPAVVKERDRLMKENKEKLEAGDVVVAANIENKLIEKAKEELKDEPGLDLYQSGARGSFKNNYKNNSIMKGPVYNPITGKWDVVGTNYMEGIEKKDIPVVGNGVVTGQYPKSIGTATSGYLSKQLIAAFQGVVLDKPGSDCGTKNCLDILVTDWVAKDIRYNYIVEGNKLVLLDDETIKKYIGKRVKMRSPMFCRGDKLCNKCAGDMFYKLGVENIGLTTSRASATILNLNMKKAHDATANIASLDVKDLTL